MRDWLRRKGLMTRFWPTVLIMGLFWGGLMGLAAVLGFVGAPPILLSKLLIGSIVGGLAFGLIWTSAMFLFMRLRRPPE